MLRVGASDHLQATCSPEPRGGALGAHPRSPLLWSSPCPAPEAASQRNWSLSPRKLRGPQSWPTGAWGRRCGRVTVPQTRDWLLRALSLSKTGITEQWGQVHQTRPGLGSNSGLTTSETTNLGEATLLPPRVTPEPASLAHGADSAAGPGHPLLKASSSPPPAAPCLGRVGLGRRRLQLSGLPPPSLCPQPTSNTRPTPVGPGISTQALCWNPGSRPGPRPQSCGLGQS